MRIAAPVWENRISPVLDSATRLLILEVKEDGELSRSEIDLLEKDPPGRCRRIKALGLDALICGAVTRRFSEMIKASGVFLIHGISGPPDKVLEACLEGRLNGSRFLMPGCRPDGLEEFRRCLNLRGGMSPKFRNLKKKSSSKEGF